MSRTSKAYITPITYMWHPSSVSDIACHIFVTTVPMTNDCMSQICDIHPVRVKVKASADCFTKNVVYVIECKKCAIQYVGETENALHIRLTGHSSDINHRRTDRPMAKHFCQSDHSIRNVIIMDVEKIHKNNVNLRLWKESYWISVLRMLYPEGLVINATPPPLPMPHHLHCQCYAPPLPSPQYQSHLHYRSQWTNCSRNFPLSRFHHVSKRTIKGNKRWCTTRTCCKAY